MLAQGQVGRIVERKRLRKASVVKGAGAERANAALYFRLLRGVRALAFALQGREHASDRGSSRGLRGS